MNQLKSPIIFAPFKSPFLAIILAVLLGPLGLVYSTFVGSIVMLVITFIFALISPYTSLFLVYLCWVVCLYWTVLATNAYNKRIFSQLHVQGKED